MNKATLPLHYVKTEKDILSNVDETYGINKEIEQLLRSGPFYASFSSRRFYGKVWFTQGRFHCEVWQLGFHLHTVEADSIEGLRNVLFESPDELDVK